MADLTGRILVQKLLADVTLQILNARITAQNINADVKTDFTNQYRFVNELLQLSDINQFNLAKTLEQDLVNTSDSLLQEFFKVNEDSINFTDAFISEVTKVFESLSETSDVQAYLLDKKLEDIFINHEEVFIDLVKFLETEVAMNDLSVAGDKYIFHINKSVLEAANISDSDVLNIGKVSLDSFPLDENFYFVIRNTTVIKTFTSETFLTTDAGFILLQNYCEPLYFADDYVGTTRILN
jgi:hypothetical protein